MCGICGIALAAPDARVDAARVVRMRDTLAHRGPDGAGVRCELNVGLGHRRLSVVDLAGGAQPLSNEDGTVWVTFNGEIYNFPELARELRSRGHAFRTRSDTEVLAHGYEEWGDTLPARLNGMFAFAVHDLRRRRVLLARDHFGIKPLFYSVTPHGLFFGSEIKAVLAGTGAAAEPSSERLHEYLAFRYVAGANTFFRGVHRLPPAHAAVWEDGSLRVWEYWNPPAPGDDDRSTLAEARDELEAHLERAVRMQLMSDVPLGAFCSGGVDSGLVTGYAARARGARTLSFSVGFDDPAWDETPLARDSAARAGTEHQVLPLRPGDVEPLLARLIGFYDEPLSHPNAVPLYLLSRFARREVTVVLTGEGADEVFGGYPRWHLARPSGAPAPLRRALAAAAGLLPGHRAARLAALLPLAPGDALILNSAFVAPERVERLTGGAMGGAMDERRRLLAEARAAGGDPVATLSRYELRTYLESALDRMDRVSMAVGLEARVPFLDVRMVEWALRLPTRLKIAGTENKRVVKALAERRLSPRVARGRKSGFGLPLADWFRGGPLAGVLERLRDPAHPAAAHFDAAEVRALVAAHATGAADHSEALWLLANVYLWHEVHAASPRSAPAPALVPA
ncbi:asparagine synthase (glutamine-hydrolyzing) [Longimicrobium sp.]|uniref:asparagine synthase (glutamine-hydrolyzing) n=1 Tax=Longimicrobium sp. TaxID=2029185 RepID=UPI002C233E3F|nr:asparagine synthase (glutamine-hydrolyzing) [Longimicrobium sp.]HSU13298.1 asparagine synthase (glutamine-hydrolyzing) [Longimicrobium sp.]